VKSPAQAVNRPEQQQLHRALAATHDHANLPVLETPLELEQDGFPLVEGQFLHGTVELIALRCGFGTAAGLRLHFRRVLATSPLVYRRTFRRIGA